MTGGTDRLIVSPKPAEQLAAHDMSKLTRAGGALDIYMDSSLVPEADMVLLVSEVKGVTQTEFNMEPHKHDASEIYALIGDVTVEVTLEDKIYELKGPKCVFIPPGMSHRCRILGGNGVLVGIVRKGKYDVTQTQ